MKARTMLAMMMAVLMMGTMVWAAEEAAAPAKPAAETPRMRGPQGPMVNSPEVSADRQVTFRILAAKAESVKVTGGDMPEIGPGKDLTKNDQGVWEVKVGPVAPGAYRYNFNVDGVSVIDPRNPATSESNNNTWSLVVVPGSEIFDVKDVPHGAVAQVTYYSQSLKRFRRMHIYTPPGYEINNRMYPVFYLLHGASDSDASWSTVGRAGFILDNLIAAGKAKPMIVVMPAGHTGPFSFGGGRLPVDEFTQDFQGDIRPYVEKHYRVLTDAKNRAIAGLSMGGMQTLNIAFNNLADYAYIGVYSSGIFGMGGGMGGNQPQGPSWEEQRKDTLDNADLKKGVKLLWFATGKDDFLVKTSQASVEMLKGHGFDVIYKETDGAHTWINWREYL
ncbi:MAG: esterase, partial [Phycisphaerae bacterium]|nr:esterase [Phycisphaerae bacterium]